MLRVFSWSSILAARTLTSTLKLTQPFLIRSVVDTVTSRVKTVLLRFILFHFFRTLISWPAERRFEGEAIEWCQRGWYPSSVLERFEAIPVGRRCEGPLQASRAELRKQRPVPDATWSLPCCHSKRSDLPFTLKGYTEGDNFASPNSFNDLFSFRNTGTRAWASSMAP